MLKLFDTVNIVNSKMNSYKAFHNKIITKLFFVKIIYKKVIQYGQSNKRLYNTIWKKAI